MVSSHRIPAKWQEQTSAIFSGFLGEWLHQRQNPMAFSMDLRFQDEVLDIANPSLDAARPTLVVLVHGLTELETVFDYPERPGENYATELAVQLDATPLSLRYNSGRSISSNGAAFDQLLAELVAHWPMPVKRLILIGHSMGGLVTRSACYQASRQPSPSPWLCKLESCVYIGSPHEGSWLARAAHKSADVLGKAPRDYVRAIADFLNVRSPGIHDLAEGNIHPDHEALQQPPLVEGVRHYAVAGLLASQSSHPVSRLFGDALVQESSATGSRQTEWKLTATAVFPRIDHIRLSHHPLVYRQLKEWLV